MAATVELPDPTTPLDWDNYRGAIHEIFASNAARFPDRTCVVETLPTSTAQRVFTYGQINEASNQLAHHFLDHGCNVGDVAMIYAYRGVDLVVAYMGALKAGATVSVLDPQYPPDRQKILLDVARPSFLVCIRRAIQESGELDKSVTDFVAETLSVKATVPALCLADDGGLQGGNVEGVDCLTPQSGKRTELPKVQVGPDSIPTLSFTSGSEGRPKGVQGRFFSLTYYFPWMAERFGLSEDDRFSMLSGIAHDPIQRDIFTPLFLGAKLYCPPAEVITYELLAEWMKTHSITVTHLTPAMGQVLVGGSITQFPALRNAFFVGDLLTKKDCAKLRNLAPNTNVINLYGSTETQRAVSYFPVPSKNQDPDFLDQLPDIIPIGQGMLNVQLLVIDQNDRTRQCDVGEQGEIYIRAAGLAEGYLGTDEKTAELNRSKFVSNWFVDPAKWTDEFAKLKLSDACKPWMAQYKGPRDRIYKTGDIGRIRADGSAECIGRVDLQVKIRGFRIELGEIDVHLSQHEFVRENITVVRRDKDEEQTLVTYFVPETKRWIQHLREERGRLDVGLGPPDESMAGMLKRFKTLSLELKQYLATKLPKYAVPTIIIPLARMPLSKYAVDSLRDLTGPDPNGKIDRPSLPFPDATDLTVLTKRRTSSVAARMTDTQLRLAKIWASVLPNRTARMLVPESNFFDEGGHSILAQQMFFLVKKEWRDIDVPVNTIFQSQTLEALAAEVDRALDPIGLRLDAMPLPADGVVRDEAYEADARDLVRRLPSAIKTAEQKWSKGGSPPTILLTGATGFLGSYILRELLELPIGARLIAHVRAADAAAGLARLESIGKAYGLWSAEWTSGGRLEAVVGDISRPQLGLSRTDWARLTADVDVVIHNGAQVNWMLPYSSLRAANVLSTVECVRLCTEGRAKALTFVSSTSTLDSAHYVALSQAGGAVTEADDLAGSRKGLATGYGQSKWASEFVVREAGRRGLRGAVVRPGYVTGDPASGFSVTDDFLVRLWKGCVQVGARPDVGNTLNAVPVPRVARVVAAAALCMPAAGGETGPDGPAFGVAQVTARPRPTLNAWMAAVDEHGYSVPRIPYGVWRDAVKGYVGDPGGREELALLPLFHFVVGDLPETTVAPEMDDARARAALAAYADAFGLDQAGDDEPVATVRPETMGAYLAYLVGSGFMKPPTGKGQRELPVLGEVLTNGHLGGRSAKA